MLSIHIAAQVCNNTLQGRGRHVRIGLAWREAMVPASAAVVAAAHVSVAKAAVNSLPRTCGIRLSAW